MIIEFTDGPTVYYEARDPEVARLVTPVPASSARDWAPSWERLASEVTLRIKGGGSRQIWVMQESGEIPPELADQAVTVIDNLTLSFPPGGTLGELRPYLARIAGRQA
jgi:hypothetical protein